MYNITKYVTSKYDKKNKERLIQFHIMFENKKDHHYEYECLFNIYTDEHNKSFIEYNKYKRCVCNKNNVCVNKFIKNIFVNYIKHECKYDIVILYEDDDVMKHISITIILNQKIIFKCGTNDISHEIDISKKSDCKGHTSGKHNIGEYNISSKLITCKEYQHLYPLLPCRDPYIIYNI